MPIFEYKCEKCGGVSEFLVGVSQDSTVIKCKSCGSDQMKKILSSFATSCGSKGPESCDSCDFGGSCDAGSCCSRGACNH